MQPGYWNENFHVLPDDDKINGVVLLIGVNGVTYNDNLPNKKELIDDLVKKYPKKTIYIEKVFPVGKTSLVQTQMILIMLLKLTTRKLKVTVENILM